MQAVHDVAFPVENSPSVQLTGSEVVSAQEYPAGQPTHALPVSVFLYEPSGQAAQTVDPATDDQVPSLQVEQVEDKDAPLTLDHEPVAQLMQFELSEAPDTVDHVPATQLTQAVAPEVEDHAPAGQFRH